MDRAAVNENRPVDDHRLAVAEAASKYASRGGRGGNVLSNLGPSFSWTPR